MTAIQGFEYPSNIQFEEKDDLLVQKNKPGYFKRMDTIRQRNFIAFALIGVGFVVTVLTFRVAVVNEMGASSATFCIFSPILTAFFVSIYFIPTRELNLKTFKHEYVGHLEDSKFREACLKELKENGKNINDLLSYIDQHGTENIQKWGFRLHPNSCPLITKEIIRDFIMDSQDMPTLFLAFGKNCYLLPKEKNESQGTKFIEFVEKHAILSPKDKKEIEKKVV